MTKEDTFRFLPQQFLKAFFRDIENRVDAVARRYYLTEGALNMQKILIDFEKYIIQIGKPALNKKRRSTDG